MWKAAHCVSLAYPPVRPVHSATIATGRSTIAREPVDGFAPASPPSIASASTTRVIICITMFSQSGGSGARGCVLVVLAGCASPRPAPLLESRPPPSHLGDTLTSARRAHGALLIVSSGGEITALTPDLEPVATIAHRAGHDGQVIGTTFYALGDRELFEVDLDDPDTRLVVWLQLRLHRLAG